MREHFSFLGNAVEQPDVSEESEKRKKREKKRTELHKF